MPRHQRHKKRKRPGQTCPGRESDFNVAANGGLLRHPWDRTDGRRIDLPRRRGGSVIGCHRRGHLSPAAGSRWHLKRTGHRHARVLRHTCVLSGTAVPARTIAARTAGRAVRAPSAVRLAAAAVLVDRSAACASSTAIIRAAAWILGAEGFAAFHLAALIAAGAAAAIGPRNEAQGHEEYRNPFHRNALSRNGCCDRCLHGDPSGEFRRPPPRALPNQLEPGSYWRKYRNIRYRT